MDRQTGHRKGGIERTESIDVVYHAQQDRGRKSSMGGKALEVVVNGDSRRRPRMKPSESTLMQWDLVVELDQLHQHARDQEHNITGIRQFIVFRKQFDFRP